MSNDNRIVLRKLPASVIKNSTWNVDEQMSNNDTYKDLVWKKAQSVQITDQKDIYKVWGAEWMFNHLPFWTMGEIQIVFIPKK